MTVCRLRRWLKAALLIGDRFCQGLSSLRTNVTRSSKVQLSQAVILCEAFCQSCGALATEVCATNAQQAQRAIGGEQARDSRRAGSIQRSAASSELAQGRVVLECIAQRFDFLPSSRRRLSYPLPDVQPVISS